MDGYVEAMLNFCPHLQPAPGDVLTRPPFGRQVQFLESHPIAITPRQHLISVMFIRCAERDRLRALVDEAVERMSDCAIESGRIAVRDPYSLTLIALKNRFEIKRREVEQLRNSLESHRREHGC